MVPINQSITGTRGTLRGGMKKLLFGVCVFFCTVLSAAEYSYILEKCTNYNDNNYYVYCKNLIVDSITGSMYVYYRWGKNSGKLLYKSVEPFYPEPWEFECTRASVIMPCPLRMRFTKN